MNEDAIDVSNLDWWFDYIIREQVLVVRFFFALAEESYIFLFASRLFVVKLAVAS